jgi:hypothetical protein
MTKPRGPHPQQRLTALEKDFERRKHALINQNWLFRTANLAETDVRAQPLKPNLPLCALVAVRDLVCSAGLE